MEGASEASRRRFRPPPIEIGGERRTPARSGLEEARGAAADVVGRAGERRANGEQRHSVFWAFQLALGPYVPFGLRLIMGRAYWAGIKIADGPFFSFPCNSVALAVDSGILQNLFQLPKIDTIFYL